ncbi:hypothetical protein CRG98_039833 [Punica granatum]|uniref:Uncharacterized protein n=1 Tax=Punica granatum TaxID=22663 RepID=A0A2I0I732_PUNGR|nr:hypothetical protein CRG98_039833 [Punica granatum]
MGTKHFSPGIFDALIYVQVFATSSVPTLLRTVISTVDSAVLGIVPPWFLADTGEGIFKEFTISWFHFIRLSHRTSLIIPHLVGEGIPGGPVPFQKQRSELLSIWSDGPLMPHVSPAKYHDRVPGHRSH